MSDPTLDEAYQADVQASLHGAGGGKGGGGGSTRTPREEPNTLRSTSKARIIDALCEGSVVGLVDGARSIYLADTPLQNEDGSYNFQGVTVHTRTGEPDQSHIAGFPAIETAHDVSAEVLAATPIVRTVGNIDANAVRVTIQLPALTRQNKENGDMLGASVELAIDVRSAGGSWSEQRRDTINGKTTSPYQRTYRVDLPGSGPWEVRVRRLTADSEESVLRNQTYWATYTEVIDAKLSYPDTALVGLEVDAQQFGNQVPARAYDIKGLIVQVPSNYNPETRTYSGLWDGSFKLAWSDNPAWCFLDLATSERYGAGLENVDKWSLYQIAQYCDELVPDGYGADEPRFTFNTVLSSREDAISALATLASAFRGMTYWGANTVMAAADMPGDPVKLVTPANVIDGEFEYAGTALKERHSVALVSWNDPADNYRLQVEVVEDAETIQQFGWRQLDVTAVGCTSRGQAHRLGKWMLASERAETETVTYAAGVDHADVRPGDIIALSDPTTAGARLGGRILATGLQELELDAVPEAASGSDWYLDALLPSGGIERRAVSAFAGNRVTLANPLSAEPVLGAVWLLSSQAVEPRQFRVLSVTEQDAGVYAITALEHDPTKYGRIELGLDLPEPDYSLIPTGPVVAPYSITVETYTYLAGGTEHQGLTISWTPSDDARVTTYIAEVQGPDDVSWGTVYTGAGTSFDLRDVAPGQWMIRVRGMTGTGSMSPWSHLTTNVSGLLLPLRPTAVEITEGNFEIVLRPQGLQAGALWEYWRATAPLQLDEIESNAVLIATTTDLVDTDVSPGTTYYYWIRARNAYGVSDWYPVQATTRKDPDVIMDLIEGEIRESHLYQSLKERVDMVDRIPPLELGLEDVEGSVTQFTQEIEDLQDADAALAQQIDTTAAALDGDIAAVQQSTTAEVSRLDGRIDTNADLITTVQSDAADGLATVQQDLSTEVSRLDDRVDVVASDISTVQSSVDDGLATAQQNMTTEVTRLDGRIDATASDITTVQTSLGDQISSVEQTLETRIEQLGGVEQNNLIPNGTLSSDNFVGWQHNYLGSIASLYNPGLRARPNGSDDIREGSIHLPANENTAAELITPLVPVMPGESYGFAAEVSANGSGTTPDIRLRMTFADASGSIIQWANGPYGTYTGNGWNQIEPFSSRAPEGAAYVRFRIQQASVAPGSTRSYIIASLRAWKVDAVLGAQYTLNLDVNGYVSGFGAYNDGTTSDFGVLADRFWIARPGAAGSEVMPFIVSGNSVYMRDALIADAAITRAKIADAAINNAKIANATITNAKIVNNTITNAKIADAAITSAKIANAAITTAKIGDAAVDTLKIAGNAVTIPAGVVSTGTISANGWTDVISVNFNPQGGAVQVVAGASYLVNASGAANGLSASAQLSGRIRQNTSVITNFGTLEVQIDNVAPPSSGGDGNPGLARAEGAYTGGGRHSGWTGSRAVALQYDNGSVSNRFITVLAVRK